MEDDWTYPVDGLPPPEPEDEEDGFLVPSLSLRS